MLSSVFLWNWFSEVWCIHVCTKEVTFFAFLTNGGLTSAFSDMNMATISCFCTPFAWNTFSYPFTLSLYIFASDVNCSQETNGWSCFLIQNASLLPFFLFQSSPIFICRGYPIISLITSHISESVLELFCCNFLYLFCRSEQSQALRDHLDWDHTTENRWTKELG
jgi:hypothetical protein